MKAARRILAAAAVLATAAASYAALQEGQPPPYITTPERVVERMLDMAGVSADDTVIDLGSGDGRIVLAAARRGAQGIGVEMSPDLVRLARDSAGRQGLQARARFVQGDALQTDLAPATVLTLYLGPEFNDRLMPRILAQMRPGTRVVSHDFGLGTWEPDALERFEVPEKNFGRGGESTVMLWVVPAEVRGRWALRLAQATGSEPARISIEQQFQQVEGHVRARSGWIAVTRMRLRGDELSFVVPSGAGELAGRYRARVDGTRMSGSVERAPGLAPVPFSAERVGARPDPEARR